MPPALSGTGGTKGAHAEKREFSPFFHMADMYQSYPGPSNGKKHKKPPLS